MTTNALASTIVIDTDKAPQFIDITERVVEHVKSSNVLEGIVVVYSMHTTAAIKINEYEPLLIKDMEDFLSKLASPDAYYRHNDFDIRTVKFSIWVVFIFVNFLKINRFFVSYSSIYPIFRF